MRIFLAATGSGMTRALKKQTVNECHPRYILETFYNGEKRCVEGLKIVGNDNFLLDSGAFSFMNGTMITLQQMDDYIHKYIDFINRYKIKHFFEIDVDSIFGLNQVEYWRRRVENATGRQCIPVWHKSRGVEYWKQMCKRYSYIAVGGFAIKALKSCEYDLIRKMVEYAYFHNVKVHGLGFTKTQELDKFKFYSVDSSTYTVGAARGQQLHTFNGQHIESRKLDTGNKKVKLGELVAHNMKEWVKYQKYMDMRKY